VNLRIKEKMSMKSNFDLLLVKLYHRIAGHVAHVNLAALFNNVRMFAHHQPSNVGKKEATVGVVRVCVGFAVLVVHAVVAHPLENCVLKQRNFAR
jgi:hypothetical protein